MAQLRKRFQTAHLVQEICWLVPARFYSSVANRPQGSRRTRGAAINNARRNAVTHRVWIMSGIADPCEWVPWHDTKRTTPTGRRVFDHGKYIPYKLHTNITYINVFIFCTSKTKIIKFHSTVLLSNKIKYGQF